MSKFLFLFRGGDGRMADLSPEQIQEHMQKWGAWMGELGAAGTLIAGEPLQSEGKVVAAGNLVTDGPFAEGKELVGGYLLINAENLDQAVEISKGCPIYEHHGTTEVREIAPMNM